MPYKRRRLSTMEKRQLDFRLGKTGAGGRGTKPFLPRTKVYKAVAAEFLNCTATTAGDSAIFAINNYNTPLELEAASTFTPSILGKSFHPSGHAEAISQGYKRARVLSTYYRVVARFVGGNDSEQDWVIAYKFSTSNAIAGVFTAVAANAGLPHWLNMRSTRGWVYKEMSASASGGSVFPSQAIINIRVPDCERLIRAMFNETSAIFGKEEMGALISDSVDAPAAEVFCHIHIFTVSGKALSVRDISLDITSYQDVRLDREIQQEEMIDEVDDA